MSEFVSGFITQTKMDFTIRAASLEDCKDIRRMMSELAEYEKVTDHVTAHGKAELLEDLYVMPEFRGKGIGKALMSKVAQLGRATGCTQLNFKVLNWNKTALDFYLNQGSTDVTSDLGYHCMCCHGLAFQKLADKEF